MSAKEEIAYSANALLQIVQTCAMMHSGGPDHHAAATHVANLRLHAEMSIVYKDRYERLKREKSQS